MDKKFNNIQNKCIVQDGKEYWISRSVTVTGIVIVYITDSRSLSYNNAYVLIAKRGTGAADYNGFWNLPCGYLDWNETGIEACEREIYEETGIDISKYKFIKFGNPFGISTDCSENNQNVSLRYLLAGKMNKDEFDKIKASLNTDNSEKDEVEEIKFIKISDYKNYKFAFNHDKIIEEIKMAIIKNSIKY